MLDSLSQKLQTCRLLNVSYGLNKSNKGMYMYFVTWTTYLRQHYQEQENLRHNDAFFPSKIGWSYPLSVVVVSSSAIASASSFRLIILHDYQMGVL